MPCRSDAGSALAIGGAGAKGDTGTRAGQRGRGVGEGVGRRQGRPVGGALGEEADGCGDGDVGGVVSRGLEGQLGRGSAPGLLPRGILPREKHGEGR